MTEADAYILNAIRKWVWSGFYSADQVDEMIGDILEADADEPMLRASVGAEFQKKVAAEASWPERTDCDRLDQAFASLDAAGIVALQNAGMTMSDGLDDVSEAFHERGRENVRGYCFYHGQDQERAVAGAGLMIAFGGTNDDKRAKAGVGREVKQAFEREGLVVGWSGEPEKRIDLPHLNWQRRGKR